MQYCKSNQLLENRNVWVITLENDFSKGLTLLLSKVSEAILPKTLGNHIGPGSTMDSFLEKQKDVKFIINGGFNHYRKDFYDWKHTNFNVGDPVGLVKIREHYFEDVLDIENYGFFIQKSKGMPWEIVKYEELSKNEKYILGCTPLLIEKGNKTVLPFDKMQPMPEGQINPPSVLGHGLQCHPRTAIGIKDNNLVFVVVEKSNEQDGCTLPELQEIGLKLQLDTFLNLDGGGSSQFRILENEKWIVNHVSQEDKNRLLGNVIVLFADVLN